jgi:hypothetical protein
MDTKPWWQSKTIWGGLVTALVAGLSLFHVNISDLAPELTTGVLGTVGLIGTILVIVGRVKAAGTIITATSQLARGSLFFAGCANMTPQQKAIATSAETLASIAATAAATYYGGPQAGQLASAGLSGLGSVLQGYVGLTVPTAVVQNSPGIAGVGEAIAAQIPSKTPISQSTVDMVNRAAAIAALLKAADVMPIPAATPAPTP